MNIKLLEKFLPDYKKDLDEFYAKAVGLSVDEWVTARKVVISKALYNFETDDMAGYDALFLVRKAYEFLPPDIESSWNDGDDKFVEFSVTGKQLRDMYFSEIKKIINLD